MFTVLIAEKEHIDAIQKENRLFFEPFLENKEIAFCCWNPRGRDLYDAVPELSDIVGRQKNWRAVVINSRNDAFLSRQNPFDTADCSAMDALKVPDEDTGATIEEREKEWKEYFEALSVAKEEVYRSSLENPLQKLSTWLCFRPEDYILNEVKEKQDIDEWAMEMIGEDLKMSAKLEVMERSQYKRELRMKENIRREFAGDRYLNIAYPSEIHCISLRTARNGFFDPDTFWNVRRDSDYSAFADRNMFFDKMRFMVFDLLPKDHRNFRNDYIRFLATVLIFISNPVPGSAMKSRRLYRFETETDDTPLCTLVSSYDKKLSETFGVIENEMEKIRSEIPGELSDKDAEQLFCGSSGISIAADDTEDSEKVFVSNKFGLFFDSPENEDEKWDRESKASIKELSRVLKHQDRTVKKCVTQSRYASEISGVNISRLTPFQMDDILEYADSSEDEMVESIPENLADTSKYTKRLEDEAEKVKKIIRGRMKKKTVFALGAICVGLFLVTLLPFIIANLGTEESVTNALIVCGSMVLTLVTALVITVLLLRLPVKKAVRGYNNCVHSVTAEMRASMNMFPKYLSAFCNVKKGHAVRNYAKKNVDEYTRSLRIRKRHQEDIRKRRAFLEESYSDYLCGASFCDETMVRPYEYDFDQQKEYDYPAPFLAGDCRQIEFISSGNFVTVPSSFITGVAVRMEGIYDK